MCHTCSFTASLRGAKIASVLDAMLLVRGRRNGSLVQTLLKAVNMGQDDTRAFVVTRGCY